MVASSAYLKGLATRQATQTLGSEDPLQVNDPWARAIAGGTPSASTSSKQWMQVANQVERNVLAKVGQESRSPTTHSAPQVDQAAPAANVENIVMAKVEKRLGSLEAAFSSQVQTLGGRVEEVAKDVRDQEHTLRGMFSEQMLRIEELINPKRNRRE